MTSSPDSSSELPAAPPVPAAPRPPQMSPERKKALLTSKKTDNAIRKIARARRVAKNDRDEIVQSTLTLAWKARLPEAEGEATKIVNKIAFIQACVFMNVDPLGQRESYVEEQGDEEGEPATRVEAPPPPVEVRDVLARLTALGVEKFPTGFESYLEGKLKSESSVEIAARRGVTDGHVRKEAQLIQEFLREHGRKMGLVTAVAIVLLVVAAIPIDRWRSRMTPYDGNDLTDYAPIRTNPPAPDATALRERARAACAEGAWQACLDDLDAAKKLDPVEESMEVVLLRLSATNELVIREAPHDDGTFNNVKPPLY